MSEFESHGGGGGVKKVCVCCVYVWVRVPCVCVCVCVCVRVCVCVCVCMYISMLDICVTVSKPILEDAPEFHHVNVLLHFSCHVSREKKKMCAWFRGVKPIPKRVFNVRMSLSQRVPWAAYSCARVCMHADVLMPRYRQLHGSVSL